MSEYATPCPDGAPASWWARHRRGSALARRAECEKQEGEPVVAQYTSPTYVYNIADITGTFSGQTFADNFNIVDLASLVQTPFTDKDGNILYGVDSEFGFNVTDFVGAEQKTLDMDFAEGFAGNIFDPSDPGTVTGLALRNTPTEVFKAGGPFGTWSLGLGGQTVKASTEHYTTMAQVLSDQRFPDDPDALAPLDNDLRLREERPTGPDGAFEPGPTHNAYVAELSEALQRAIDNTAAGTNPQTYSDLDFDRDGTPDPFDTLTVQVDFDSDGDGVPESTDVGALDLDQDGTADVVDSFLNGYGAPADLTDLVQPNEASVTFDIAYGEDYSVTLKDDGKLLYRFGEAVKRPNDLRMEAGLELPEEWTADLDGNGTADILEGSNPGFNVLRAELIIDHNITNNPNDQIRPEDYENEAAIGRLPSYYIVQDPDDPSNILWVSPRDSFNGEGEALPSYFALTETGEIDMSAGGTPVRNPNGVIVGYRNTDSEGDPIGTVLRDMSLAAQNAAAGLDFSTEDLAEGFTADWYTSVDREPFEWSYDSYAIDPYRQVFESFRTPEEAAAAGYDESELVSGPRWRLTPNKFGQDLPGLEVPATPNTAPPYQRDNIKYVTGEPIVTTLNLLDWDEDLDGDGLPDPSPLSHSSGWMTIDPTRLDENGDGLIDEGWSGVNGSLGAGDAIPTGLILSAVSPNGLNLSQNFLDVATYVKGDRQDSANVNNMQLEIEYEAADAVIGAVQQVTGLTDATSTVTYQDGERFADPVVFATPPSLNGAQTASIAVSEVTAESVDLHVAEPDHLDGTHWAESVSLLTLEEGAWDLSDGSRLEVGTVAVGAGPTDSFTSVSFGESFDEAPTVLV